jgi:hypothetical protein
MLSLLTEICLPSGYLFVEVGEVGDEEEMLG